jgi:hypothetical protein
MTDPGPIQPDLRNLMNNLGLGLDEMFNGVGCPEDEKRVWFFLAAGNMAYDDAAPETSRFNYISNANKLDIQTMLRDLLARIDERVKQGGQP